MISIKQTLTRNLFNLPGWRTNRKIVVIESDDWGGIRIPTKKVKQSLVAAGMNLENDPYSLYDSMADEDDLIALFDVLSSVKDKKGKHAVITANTNVANPDFVKIRQSDYQEYFYEPFTETLNRLQGNENSFKLWQEGIKAGVFYPQFHGREHVNVRKWLHDLRRNHANVRLWFDQGCYATSHLVDKSQIGHYMVAFDSAMPSDIAFYNQSIVEGLDLFETLFGYRSESFIAPTYCWPLEIETTLKSNSVKFLQGVYSQKIPLNNGKNFKIKRSNFQGKKSKSGLIYLMRNAYFEPSQMPSSDSVGDCLSLMEIAFKWGKPATISMHRLNVMGGLVEENRTRNLVLLKQLLDKTVKRWPEVEFMSSNQLGNLITPAEFNV